ncbi:mannose-binding protein [Streptomyces cadmiisoli]|uniref:mannose-binding protein n=1 Tax=Streptomyces cadmiisoli TaxID=2184053 RepID=UPI0036481C31
MSPEHHTPGANGEPAAAPSGERAGPAPASPTSTEEPPSPVATAETEPGGTASGRRVAAGARPGAAPAASEVVAEAESDSEPGGTASGEAVAPEAVTASSGEAPVEEGQAGAPASGEPAAAEGESGAAGPPAAARTTEAPEAGLGVAAAVGTAPPETGTGTGVDRGRPRKPVLAAAAIAGVVLVAVPLLMAGGAKDEEPRGSGKGLTTGSDTVLNAESAPAAPDDYVAAKPSASPSDDKAKKTEAPPASVPAAPAAPRPSTSSPAPKKPKAGPEPTPKATPKPDWSTETVFATSVLEVNQAWTTNRIRMVMQTDGNLVVYNEQGKPVWASMTFGENHRAIFQTDGNLVIHNAADRPIWASRSHGNEGAQLVLRSDAEVVIVHNGRVVWST